MLAQYLALPPIVPTEVLQLGLKVIFSLSTAGVFLSIFSFWYANGILAHVNPVFSLQQNPLGSTCINTLMQLTSLKLSAVQFLVVSILDNLSKLRMLFGGKLWHLYLLQPNIEMILP